MTNMPKGLRLAAFKLRHPLKKRFTCPVCKYHGPFRDLHPETGTRLHAKCPSCNTLERHRLQYLVVNEVFKGTDTSSLRVLHFAPEPFFRKIFATLFTAYETADLAAPGVDHHVDLQALPFADATYDVVYASHVLEHIPDDRKALTEIRRILRPGGMAILPVPIVNPTTIEYPQPNPHESGHVRAPGRDYYDRYRDFFDTMESYHSEDFPEANQTFEYVDLTNLPNEKSPLRVAMPGFRHSDCVPVCRVAQLASS